ncbi:zona pellucida sperm-binding protein 4 [Austrofundulus limnaeus]|uniref:Zona pellucida sperm-binding protein 4 n=1 Tax=Austrofundulus limnaeus TaxID=52670 RepID=A0A2I4D326_AUSLI|nr:PREDICTED: zona pellucida sperm-binding protein 4-like [Austrofundulus limnaeus]
MELYKWLFGVVVLICGASAQNYWMQPPAQKPQLSPEFQNPLSKVPPPTPSFDKCVVEEEEKIHCGSPDITAEQCEAISCCFDGRWCYYGKTVTVQCTRDGQFVVVVAREITLPPIDVNSISLLDSSEASCSPVDGTSAFVIFQFPVTACGTALKDEDGYVVYENHMSSSYEVGVGHKGSITRDSHFELLFQCRYSGTTVEALVLEVNPVPPPLSVAATGPLRVELRLGSGQCHMKGCVEDVAAYSSFYTAADYPINKLLREPVFAEVRLLERSDPNLVLNLEHCWATATPNPEGLPQWDLLVDGCPYHDDRYQTTTIPVDESSGLEFPTHYKRFVSRMFTFVAPEDFSPHKETVFFHCSTMVCHQGSTTSCEQQCRRKRRAALKVPSSQRSLVSSGEVILTRLHL